MNGFTLSCGGSGADGIHLDGSGAVLQKGTVRDCDIGVEVLPNTSNHRVQTMVLEHNGEDGLDTGGSGTWVTQSIARNNGERRFENRRGGNSFFIGNRATGNGDHGFLSQDPEGGSTFSRNVASSNGREGFHVSLSAINTTVSQNVAQGNSEDGFLVRSDNNTVTRNVARNNLDDGIDVDFDSTGNTLTQNVGSGNGSADLEGNGGFDLEDDNLDCDNNTWRGNVGSRNQPCIR
jgi:parallel beta-helix repeat protein